MIKLFGIVQVCFYISTLSILPFQKNINLGVAKCASIGLRLASVKTDLEKAGILNLLSKF
jgi:hypothetical protein